MPTHLAVAIGAQDTAAALAQARAVSDLATLVEYRLDLMGDFQLDRLLEESPLPAIVTCRPPREGGRFAGGERERLQILTEAVALGAPFVDVEWDALPVLKRTPDSPTRLIGSRHDFEGMLGDWTSAGLFVQAQGADIVKLVGSARTTDDVLTPFAWLQQMQRPSIGIAMGPAGAATRILAPRFPQAFLSFATREQSTAPGQIDARELAQQFGFAAVAGADPLIVFLTPPEIPWPLIARYRQALVERVSEQLALPHLLPIPTDLLTPGLMLALRLARASIVLCAAGVPRAPSLSHLGIAAQDNAWALEPERFRALCATLPKPDQLADLVQALARPQS